MKLCPITLKQKSYDKPQAAIEQSEEEMVEDHRRVSVVIVHKFCAFLKMASHFIRRKAIPCVGASVSRKKTAETIGDNPQNKEIENVAYCLCYCPSRLQKIGYGEPEKHRSKCYSSA